MSCNCLGEEGYKLITKRQEGWCNWRIGCVVVEGVKGIVEVLGLRGVGRAEGRLSGRQNNGLSSRPHPNPQNL